MAHTQSMTARPYCDVRKFSIVDGLAANTISDMKQAPDGLMWFSTWNGLSYYDGYSFYTFRDVPGGEDVLSTNRIIAIYPTARNNVWCVSSDRKIYLYNTHSCKFLNSEKSINEQFGINLKVDKLYPIKKVAPGLPPRTETISSESSYRRRRKPSENSSRWANTVCEMEKYGMYGATRKAASGFSQKREPLSTSTTSAHPSPLNGLERWGKTSSWLPPTANSPFLTSETSS